MNSHSTGEVTASSTASTAYGGGLVGQNSSGSITNSYATADITAESDANKNVHGGGLVGENFSKGTISNSHATGDVKVSSLGNTHGGGLVGTNYSTDYSGTISNSHATGDVEAESTSGTSFSGGLVGNLNNRMEPSQTAMPRVMWKPTSTASNTDPNGGGLVGLAYGTIVNSYATGDVTVSGTRYPSAGGLAGSLNGGKIVNSYATGDVEVNNLHAQLPWWWSGGR